MKKTYQSSASLFIIFFLMTNSFVNAQWLSKASRFPAPHRGINELIAVNSNVTWAMAYDADNPLSFPISEFTITTDGGDHWTSGKISAFPDYYLVSIAPLSATLCYASIANLDNGNAKVVKTTNGGVTWTEQLNYDFGASFGFFADIYFFNANEGLLYGDQSDGYFTIFTTSDGGTHWTRVPQANMPAALADESSYVFAVDGLGSTFWTVSSSGRIWKTIDKGLHWAAYQTQETLIDFSNLKMRDALHGLWGVRDELYRTSDGGVTWKEIEPAGTWFTDDLAYVPGTASTYISTGGHDFSGYGALHGIGTSYSTDDGNTWITIDTAVEHLSVAMINSYAGLTGGINQNSSTKGIFKYNGSAFGYSCGDNLTSMCHKGNTICVESGSITNHLSKGDILGACPSNVAINKRPEIENSETTIGLNAYPNPISKSATISFSLSQSQKVSITIYDMNGRLMRILADAQMQQGAHQLTWNTKDEKGNAVNAGVYLLRMQTENFIVTKKIIVTK